MGGIEPPSDGRPRGLLRAQSASYFSAPDVMQTCLPDGLSQLSVEADPLTRSTTSGSLNDARIRAGSTTRADGLKVQTAIRQQERSRCDSVRHLLVCTHRSRAERASSTRFPSIDDRRRNRSSPIEFFNPPPPVTRWWTSHDTRREHAGQWPTGAGGEWRWRGIEPPSDAQPRSDSSPRRTVDFLPSGGTVPPPLGKKSTSRHSPTARRKILASAPTPRVAAGGPRWGDPQHECDPQRQGARRRHGEPTPRKHQGWTCRTGRPDPLSAAPAWCSGAWHARPRAGPVPRAASGACPTPACRAPGPPRPWPAHPGSRAPAARWCNPWR